jgi:hypothetical protein
MWQGWILIARWKERLLTNMFRKNKLKKTMVLAYNLLNKLA